MAKPSYSNYPRPGVIGIDWDLVNNDRKQVGREPFKEKTQFKDGKK